MKENSNKLLFGIFIGVILGGIFGAFFGPQAVTLKIFGDLFLNALKMLVVPLVFVSLVVGVTNIGNISQFGKEGAWTIFFYMLTTGIAVITGMILVNIIQPGVGMDLSTALTPDKVSGTDYSFIKVLEGIIPANLFKSMVEMDILPIIFFALFFGICLSQLEAKGKVVVDFFNQANEVILKMVGYILLTAPVGVFALVAARLGAAGGAHFFTNELPRVGKYSLTVILGLGIHGAITLPILLWAVSGRNPFTYIKNVLEALLTAFSTASSSATLPVTMDAVEVNNKISPKISGFVLPLGETINLNDTALYEAVAAMFIAQAYGIHLSASAQVIIFLTATLAAIGAAGIPQAGLVTMVIVLKSVGLPLEGIGMLLAVDWFLDRCRTTVNVFGDTVVAAMVDKRIDGKASFWQWLRS